ncbi:hypothetical protein ACI3KW_13435 [Devosia sp. ZW T5_3]|uniref:hypothetical protein n=1 Tax=Devosia sp. ZW T5_3 TaxID=3378085 RepID=UPI0038524764
MAIFENRGTDIYREATATPAPVEAGLTLPATSVFDIPRSPALSYILLLPLVFLLSGLLLRFLAFRTAMPAAEFTEYFDELCRWDCSWYVKMAETGYDRFPVPGRINAGNWAFFPSFPMLVGGVRALLPFPTIVTASLVSLVTTYMAVLAAWPLLNRDRAAYALYAAFMLSGPVSFYFTSFFTEPLYVLMTTLVFAQLARSRYLSAGVAAAILSATRIVGVFASLAIGLQALLDYRRSAGTWRGAIPALLDNPQLVLALFVAPLGLFAYMAFLHFWVGDALAFSHVQRAWARTIANPLTYLWQGFGNRPDEGWAPTSSQILATVALAGLILTGVLAWRRQWPAALFCLLAIIVPLAAGLASMLRFMSALTPLTITLMTLLARRRWLFWLSLAAILLGAYATTLAWFGGNVALV